MTSSFHVPFGAFDSFQKVTESNKSWKPTLRLPFIELLQLLTTFSSLNLVKAQVKAVFKSTQKLISRLITSLVQGYQKVQKLT
jgi:hypothetical protein